MAVNSPGPYPISPRSPKSPQPNGLSGNKSSNYFTFAPPKSPRDSKSPNHYSNKNSSSGSKASSQTSFGPRSPGGPKSPRHYGPKSPGPESPKSFNYGPKSPGAPKSPKAQQFTFGPKSPSGSKGSTQFTFGPKSPSGSRTSSTPRSPNGYHRSSSMGPRSPGSRNESSSANYSSPSTRRNSSGGSTQDFTTDTASTTSSSWSRCRKSTSDLTDLMEEECSTTATSLSRPCSPRSRTGSIKSGGGLAYLASRRGSRESNMSQVSAEDLGPLNFSSNPRGRQRRTSNFLELPVPDHIRPRVCSLPEKPYNPRCGDDLYRLRTFSITNKGGVVNCGDSIINRRSRSNTSVNSTASRHSNHSNFSGVSPGERSPFDGSCCGSSYNNMSSEASAEEVAKYRVVLLGDSGVGKTALVSQFMTSEYMNTYDASLDDEFGEKSVSVLLDGEESEMIFIDHPSVEMSVENSLSTYEPHACVVVYSIVDRATFKTSEDILNYLWRENYTQDKSVIVVGNKADLARSRVIPTNEGKALAASHDCKFIETSSGIQHNVDELLVGILKQIRLRESREKKRQLRRGSKGRMSNGRLHGSRTSLSLTIAREILNKMCLNDSKSKSCENLHVL